MSAPTQAEMMENIEKLQTLKGHIIDLKILCQKHSKPIFTESTGEKRERSLTAEQKTELVTEYKARKSKLADLLSELL